jgi:hypothetical protein
MYTNFCGRDVSRDTRGRGHLRAQAQRRANVFSSCARRGACLATCMQSMLHAHMPAKGPWVCVCAAVGGHLSAATSAEPPPAAITLPPDSPACWTVCGVARGPRGWRGPERAREGKGRGEAKCAIACCRRRAWRWAAHVMGCTAYSMPRRLMQRQARNMRNARQLHHAPCSPSDAKWIILDSVDPLLTTQPPAALAGRAQGLAPLQREQIAGYQVECMRERPLGGGQPPGRLPERMGHCGMDHGGMRWFQALWKGAGRVGIRKPRV